MLQGVEDITAATSILDATNWVLEEAVNLQFATGGDLGGAGPNHRAATTAGAQAAPDIPPHLLEEEVRAPLPVVRDRLYGDAPGPHGVPVRPARCAAAGVDSTMVQQRLGSGVNRLHSPVNVVNTITSSVAFSK